MPLLATSVLLLAAHFRSRSLVRGSGRAGRGRFRLGDALAVGVTQCVAAVFPGLSRSGSTLSVGMLRGVNRQAALDYSFVLGIPAIVAAAGA